MKRGRMLVIRRVQGGSRGLLAALEHGGVERVERPFLSFTAAERRARARRQRRDEREADRLPF